MLRFREATIVRPVLESSVIKVSYEHEVPQLAADAVNLLVAGFTDVEDLLSLYREVSALIRLELEPEPGGVRADLPAVPQPT